MAAKKGHGKGSSSRHLAAVKSWVTRRANAGAKAKTGAGTGRSKSPKRTKAKASATTGSLAGSEFIKRQAARRRQGGNAAKMAGFLQKAAERQQKAQRPTNAVYTIDPKTRVAVKAVKAKGGTARRAPLLKKLQEKLAARKTRGAQSAAEWRAIVRGGKRGGLENVGKPAFAKWRR